MINSAFIGPQRSSESEIPVATTLIGRNSSGLWVVKDPSGRRGGLFSNRAEASRFATFDHGRARAAVLVAHPLEFDASVIENG